MGEHPKKKSGIFSSLSDDLLVQVVNKVKNKQDRKSFSEVCKQWLIVEGLNRLSLMVFVTHPWFSFPALARFPNIVNLTMWNCNTRTDLEFIARTCPKIESIELNCSGKKYRGDGGILSPKGLRALGEGCPKLSHVEINGEKAIGDSGVIELVHSAHNLESLLLMSCKLSEEAFRGIGSTSSISSLEFAGCINITDEGLAILANGSISKTLKKLILDCCKINKITDTGVEHLRKMCCLELLDLSCWRTGSQITDIGGVGISAIRTLKELTLNFVDVSDRTMVAVARNCRNLEILNIRGCEKVTGVGICAFCSHKCLKYLILDELKINLSDVERVVFGCPSLEFVVVDSQRRLDPTWSEELMHEKTRKLVMFVEDCDLSMLP